MTLDPNLLSNQSVMSAAGSQFPARPEALRTDTATIGDHYDMLK